MMGIGSLFCLSRGLSLLVEVVKILNGWERRESRQGGRRAEPCRQGLPSALRPLGRSAGSGAGGCWVFTSVTFFDCRVKRSVWVSRLAERRAERLAKVDLTTQLETSHTLLLDSLFGCSRALLVVASPRSQGATYQGGAYQGATYQGGTYQGSSRQGGEYDVLS
jgi:hypothetical protein